MSAATVKHLAPTQVELDIEIPGAELERARERAFRELVRHAKLPGFRPGKIPRRLFESQYGTGQIEERALNAVVPDLYSRALEDNGIDPVDRPQIEVLPEEEGRPPRVRATVEVRPAIELHDYTGIALQSPPTAVAEGEVEEALAQLRADVAMLVPVDRPVAYGDVPTLDYEGTIDGVPFEGGKAEGQETELTQERFVPGFAAGIVGMSAGETRTVEARFPDDYANALLAGRTAEFRVTVHENKVAELPALDDDFAKRFGGPEATLASLRYDMRNRLEAQKRATARSALTAQLLARLRATHAVALPEILVEREIGTQERDEKSQVERGGLTWEDYLGRRNATEDELRTQWRAEAERRVANTFLLEAIAKAENISATASDIEAEVQQLGERYRQPPEAIRQMLRSNWTALVDGIVRTKTIEFLLEKAAVSESTLPVAEGGNPAPSSVVE